MSNIFGYIRYFNYLCSANILNICNTTKYIYIKMEKILMQVPYPCFADFRKAAMEKANWTIDQFNNRLSGRTKLNELERKALEEIANNLNKEE